MVNRLQKSTKVAAFTTIGRRIYDKFGELGMLNWDRPLSGPYRVIALTPDKQTQVQVDMTKMASDLKDADGNYTLGQYVALS